MLKRKYMIMGCLAFCLTATLFVGITASGNQNGVSVKTEGTPTVYIDPPSVTCTVGQNFTVDIRIRGLIAASHLLGWQVKLGYYNITLEVLECEEGPFMRGFQGPNGTFFVYILHQDKGYVYVGGSFYDLPDGDHDGIPGEEEDWPYDTGVLSRTTFNCIGLGECVLDLHDTKLFGQYPNGTLYNIPHNVEDGYAIVDSRPLVDLNNDGTVDIKDIVTVALAFGAKRIDDPRDPRYGEYWHDPPCPNCPH